MPIRKIYLTEQQEVFASELLMAGRYQNASELLHEGLRLLEIQAERRQAELVGIQAGVIVGFDQVARSEFAEGTGEEAIERAFRRAADKRDL